MWYLLRHLGVLGVRYISGAVTWCILGSLRIIFRFDATFLASWMPYFRMMLFEVFSFRVVRVCKNAQLACKVEPIRLYHGVLS